MSMPNISDIKEAFERWHADKFGWLNNETWPESGEYCDTLLQSRWESWQAATEAAKATSTAGELPPLPEEIEVGGEGWGWEDFQSEKTFSVEHMLHYGAACAQAAFAEAARQPAPALPVKPWEVRMQEYFAQGSVRMRTPAAFMADEIADLRAALSATNQR